MQESLWGLIFIARLTAVELMESSTILPSLVIKRPDKVLMNYTAACTAVAK
jgi:hypothetical protein